MVPKEEEQPRKTGATESQWALAVKARRLVFFGRLYYTRTCVHVHAHRFEINPAVLRREKKQQRV